MLVLVIGYMTGSNFVSKMFSQSFFLAPQEKGYFVLNDILRYIDNDADNGSSPKPPSSPTFDMFYKSILIFNLFIYSIVFYCFQFS